MRRIHWTVSPEYAASEWSEIQQAFAATFIGPESTAPTGYTKLELRLHKVKCNDETNPEWLGDDEIALGGTAVSATGLTTKINEFVVKNNFDDGEQKVYSPPKQIKQFNLLEGIDWPKYYFVTLVLAEKDMGGLADFLNELLDSVKAQVISALASALGAVIGTVSGGIVGAIIGAAVGYIVGLVWEWLKSWWSDDIFSPVTASVAIPAANYNWPNGKTDSPEYTAVFSGYGGKYTVTYDWRLLT